MSKENNKTLYIIVAVLVILVIALIVQNQIVLKKAEKIAVNEDYVKERLGEEDFLQGKELTYIKQLSSAELKQLATEYPAIYDETMQGFFDVRYDGYWIIYDPIKEQIVKKIVTQGITIS